MVNLFTGNLVKRVTLVSVPTIGSPLNFILTYNAQDTVSGPVGNKWRCTHMAALSTASGIYTLTTDSGRAFAFQASGAPNPVTSTFFPGTLGMVGSNYQITYTDGAKALFDGTAGTFGRLLSLTDPHGNVTTVGYDSSNRCATMTEPQGRQIVLGYDSSNRIISVTDPLGNAIMLAYDGYNNLNSILLPPSYCGLTYGYTQLGTTGEYMLTTRTDANSHTFTYGYDTTPTDATYRYLTSVQDAESNTITYAYSTATESTGESDLTFAQTTMTDARSPAQTWTYRFDVSGNLWRIMDPSNHWSHFRWDENQKMLAEDGGYPLYVRQYGSAAYVALFPNINNTIRRFAYDNDGMGNSAENLLYEADATGLVTQHTYDSGSSYTNGSSRHLLCTNPAQGNFAVQGNWIGQYGGDGYVLCNFNNGTDLSSLPAYITSVAQNGALDFISPNNALTGPSLGDPQALNAPGGLFRSLGYWKQTTGSPPTLTITITMAVAKAFNLSLYANSVDLGRMTAGFTNYAPFLYATYAGRDMLFTVTDSNGTQSFRVTNDLAGAWITFPVYGNALGSTITVTVTPQGANTTEVAVSAVAFDIKDDHRQTFTYSSGDANILSMTDGVGDQTQIQYNTDGSMSQWTDARSHITQFFYEDAYKNLTRIHDVYGNDTRMTYDTNGNVLSLSDANNHTWRYSYNAKNRLLTSTNPLGNVTALTWDGAGNLLFDYRCQRQPDAVFLHQRQPPPHHYRCAKQYHPVSIRSRRHADPNYRCSGQTHAIHLRCQRNAVQRHLARQRHRRHPAIRV